eukprot:scaffold58635_cov59-Cyclotella_meneghiniana.AAC.3
MMLSTSPPTAALGRDLNNAIANFSRTADNNGTTTQVEVVDGLRVLGAPIGSPPPFATLSSKALCPKHVETHSRSWRVWTTSKAWQGSTVCARYTSSLTSLAQTSSPLPAPLSPTTFSSGPANSPMASAT